MQNTIKSAIIKIVNFFKHFPTGKNKLQWEELTMANTKASKSIGEGKVANQDAKRINWLNWTILVVAVVISCFYLMYAFHLSISDYWADMAQQRQRMLYEQAAKIEEDFNNVYSLRNATISNGEKTEVILESDLFQLKLTMNANRSKVEKKTEIIKFNLGMPTLCTAFLLVVIVSSFWAGEKSYAKYEERKRKLKANAKAEKQVEQSHNKNP